MAGIVWITGASSGIGRALALEMARDGWTVAASARRREQLEELAAEGPDGAIKVCPVDVTDADAVVETVRRIENEHGSLDCVVLAAGTHTPQTLEDFRVEDYRALLDLNVMGVVNCVGAVVPGFRSRKAGHLVVVSSVAGYRGLPQAPGYGASKAALINLTESLKFELDHLGVKTQVVCPGFVRTPLTDKNPFPMPFLMEVEDAARAMYRGMQGGAFEVTFPKRFAYILKCLGLLPDGLYFRLVHKATGL